jgi:hypothetical protein
MTDFHEICKEEGSAPTLTANFGSFGTTEKHMEDKTHCAIVQKQDLHQYRTVVKA